MTSATRNQTLDANLESGSDLEEEDLEKLESDVREMAQKIAEYRKTLPDQLRSTLASILSSHTPVCPNMEAGSDPGPSRWTSSEPEELVTESQVTNEDQQRSETMIQLKERMSKNVSAIPALIKRMQECIDRIDKLDSLNGTIHPAFIKGKST